MISKDQPVESVSDLIEYFRDAETPRAHWRVGTEHEKVGVYADTGDRVPYEGPYGIGALLEKLATSERVGSGSKKRARRSRSSKTAPASRWSPAARSNSPGHRCTPREKPATSSTPTSIS